MTSLLRAPSRPHRRPRRRRAVAALTAVALTLLPAAPAGAAARSAAPPGGFDQRVLFSAAQDPGYACFRIPALVRSVRGTLLAFAEGRAHDCGDAGDIDLVLKRSTDGGRTWGPLQVATEGGGDTHGNPAPVVDRRTGRIVLAETYNKGRADGLSCATPCERTPHLQYSDDDGATWSAPRDLTRALRPAGWNSWYATGPVHGIQLTRGHHAGRLVLGVNAESYAGGRVTANHAALVHSDDGGTTWRLGAVDTWPVAADGTFRQKPSEMTLLERADGSVYVNAREQDGTDLGNRTEAVSRDGGASFAHPFRTLPGFLAPMVQASALRLPTAGGGSRTLLAAPADPDRRRAMTIHSSYDEGRTWEEADRGACVTGDWSGYSDLVTISPGLTGLFYEAGAADARDEMRFARFTDAWLGPRRGPGPTTPDRAPGARPATVLGGARAAPGVLGRALAFDGADDAVQVPFRASLALGDAPFTCALWFRYDATGGEQPLLWTGGSGSRSPQVTLVGDPAHGRITATLTTVAGAAPPVTTELSTAGAYNDGRWHLLALRRTGGRLLLTVDATATTAAPDVPGSVSRGSAFGVRLGERLDGRAHFTGALDETVVLGRALSDADLTALHATGRTPAGPVVLRLGLDRVTTP
ncbi:exo-alpha-sialidase [Streptomyces sp. NBC_01525]|uniref:exo-alpha-sialidase n=1 Tax=Streptomyces sp. NBC_01525 TaxID=2903893 RepID=UPI003862F7F8